MTTGYFSIQGYQLPAAGNRINLGPYNIPMSGVGEQLQETVSAGTTTIAVPSGAHGVAIIPPFGNPPAGVTVEFKTVNADTGAFISTEYPTIFEFDTVNAGKVPANIYLTVAGGPITLTVQFL